jgi:glucose-6-phosphate 1-dehydrogenase
MKNIKILLMGITGDLAKRKVIPAIAQFAERNKSKFSTELIGFSRSEANPKEILDLLNGSSTNSQNHIGKISYIQDQYDNPEQLNNLFSQLNKDERLIIYLAVPPSVFVPFLQKACPLHHANIDIIIEKPFGQSLQEAQSIIDQAKSCVLTRRIHFFDHYAYKASSSINSETLSHFSSYMNGNIIRVSIKALERLSAEGRASYFDQTGTLKDMIQHIITIYMLAYSYFKLPLPDTKSITIDSLTLGQYDNYAEHTEKAQNTVDTYFNLTLKEKKGLVILAESGKSLGVKNTSISLLFENEVEIVWNLDPEKHISVVQKGKEILSFNLIDNNMLDHTRLFESLISDDFSRFVSHEQILETWKLYDLINDFKIENSIKPITYLTGVYPIKKVQYL